jgi:predicted transcriptional regulator
MGDDPVKDKLSRRERQIMDRVYQRGRATAEEIRDDLPDEVSNSSVRTLLSILESKQLLRHEVEGKRFVYFPTVPVHEAGTEALRGVLATFFNNSASSAVAALIESADGSLSEEEYQRLAALIKAAGKDSG